MSCSPFELRDYWFEELGAEERREVEAHLEGCAACREEIERLRLTQQALLRLPDEEIPQRIAFISDKVFEPWWRARRWSLVAKLCLAPGLLAAMFLAGAAWVSHRTDAKVAEAVVAMEARHTTQMRDVEQAYRMLISQMNEIYRRQVEMQAASFRQ